MVAASTTKSRESETACSTSRRGSGALRGRLGQLAGPPVDVRAEQAELRQRGPVQQPVETGDDLARLDVPEVVEPLRVQPLEQHRRTARVGAQQLHCTSSAPVLQREVLVLRLLVGKAHLQHGRSSARRTDRHDQGDEAVHHPAVRAQLPLLEETVDECREPVDPGGPLGTAPGHPEHTVGKLHRATDGVGRVGEDISGIIPLPKSAELGHGGLMRALRAPTAFDGERFVPGGATVFLDEDVISGVESIGYDAPVDCPVTTFEGTILPGLFDAHVHLVSDASLGRLERAGSMDDDAVDAVIDQSLRQQAASGVTTVRDLGDVGYRTLAFRDRQRAGLPRIRAAGPPLTVAGGHCHYLGGVVEGPDAIRAAVREHAAAWRRRDQGDGQRWDDHARH